MFADRKVSNRLENEILNGETFSSILDVEAIYSTLGLI